MGNDKKGGKINKDFNDKFGIRSEEGSTKA